MQFAGRLPDDAPDPRVESAARVRALPFPVVGLTPQPSITDPGLFSFHGGTAVSRSYTLWRNPADPSDPVNLVELDDSTRAALDVMPTRQRPPWLIEIAESARYPMLWQAVRTSWNDDGHTRTSLPEQLVDHVNHVLRNRYRGRHGPQPDHVSDRDWPTSTATVNHRATARLDNADVDAVEIDTDPFVYGIGFWLRTDVAVTAVLPRDELEYLERSFVTVDGR